ncbi:MAG TPA: hypothetical protein VLA37_13505 [Sphingomonadaceae bacterium]|nr:hypothetical protein [Sphingomonadaceae bacterium]
MSKRRIWTGAGLVLFLLLALAWYDGGERPLTEIVEPVAVPESSE